ncbi:hypothetical protein D3C87_1094070 [compost metagenome]
MKHGQLGAQRQDLGVDAGVELGAVQFCLEFGAQLGRPVLADKLVVGAILGWLLSCGIFCHSCRSLNYRGFLGCCCRLVLLLLVVEVDDLAGDHFQAHGRLIAHSVTVSSRIATISQCFKLFFPNYRQCLIHGFYGRDCVGPGSLIDIRIIVQILLIDPNLVCRLRLDLSGLIAGLDRLIDLAEVLLNGHCLVFLGVQRVDLLLVEGFSDDFTGFLVADDPTCSARQAAGRLDLRRARAIGLSGAREFAHGVEQLSDRRIQADDLDRLVRFQLRHPLVMAVNDMAVGRYEDRAVAAFEILGLLHLRGRELLLRWLQACGRYFLLSADNATRLEEIHERATMLGLDLRHLCTRDIQGAGIGRELGPCPVDLVAGQFLHSLGGRLGGHWGLRLLLGQCVDGLLDLLAASLQVGVGAVRSELPGDGFKICAKLGFGSIGCCWSVSISRCWSLGPENVTIRCGIWFGNIIYLIYRGWCFRAIKGHAVSLGEIVCVAIFSNHAGRPVALAVFLIALERARQFAVIATNGNRLAGWLCSCGFRLRLLLRWLFFR